ncbi:MAG: extracellular solute-binding protein [Acidimicrobiia bacterium]
MSGPGRGVAIALVLAFTVAACSVSSDSDDAGNGLEDPGDCIPVDMAVSPEKLDLLTDLANTFNDSDRAELDDDCIFVRVQRMSSGAGATLIADDWPDPDVNGPRPVIWSPASSAWGGVVNQRKADLGEDPVAPQGEPFMLTPLVIAMPEPMASALGYPENPIGYADILALARDPAGWGAFGHPEWGPFRLGKTNPNFSTSALHATVAQYYAAAGKTGDLTLEDLNRPEVDQFARGVESSVVHYGDITNTFLNNLYRADVRGTGLTYVSAVAVEEKSVIDYNNGNPDGILDPGEQPRKPRIPLVAIYPEEGTLFSDNPFIVLDSDWVTDDERRAAAEFQEFVLEPENQRRVLEFGFRPGNPSVAVDNPINRRNGLDPNQPQTTLEVPDPAVLVGLIDKWGETRKGARVMLVIDVSGSMGDPGDETTGETKLDLAKRAAISALDQFKPEDEVGLRIFSTEISATEPTDYVDVVEIGPIGQNREVLASRIRDLVPTQGTPLYTVTEDSYRDMEDAFDAQRINAVVLLSDGRNEDDRNTDLDGLVQFLRGQNEGTSSRPVRVFPIAYGADADLGTLERIAEATNAATYDAADPTTIERVFVAVVSNF